MPPKKKMEAYKRKSGHHKYDSKRIRTSRQGHFKVTDLRNELPFSADECTRWFARYAEDQSSSSPERCIGPEGMERLCVDLRVDPEDMVMLALAWKLKASEMGYFRQSEWLQGMSELECDSCDKLKGKLDYLRRLFLNETHFKSIYQFSFDFAKTQGHRNVDIDMGKAMLQLLLRSRWCLLPQFIEFLDESRYKVVNRDQWNNILEFSRTIKPDLSNYDINGAWPVMLDEFVEKHKPVSMEEQADE